MTKKVLITGANGGFGKLTVNTLLSQGHTVAASMRNIDGKNKEAAEELRNAGAHVVEIDVTDETSVNNGVQAAVTAMGGIDVVVNNAGVGVVGMQEFFTAEDWKKLFDVNVFGVQRINRAALPHMRTQGSGLVIYITSLLGRITMPFYGPYNSSKWALEAMAENYRAETSTFGVDNCIVEPGGYATSFFDALMQPSDSSRVESYGEFMNVPEQMFGGFAEALEQNTAQNPQNVADAIVSLINQPVGQRPFRTAVDNMGMGEPINPYNEQLEQITQGIYGNFGLSHLLTPQENVEA